LRLDLAESPGGELAIDDGWVELELGPWELATIGLGFEAWAPRCGA
jgi:hypothetical protein